MPKSAKCFDDALEREFNRAVSRKSQSDGSVSAPIVRTDPVLDAIARKLFGINTVPPPEQRKMIKRAAKAGAEALRKQNPSGQGLRSNTLDPVVGQSE